MEELEKTILENSKSRKEYYKENREEILKKAKARRHEEKEILNANNVSNKDKNK